MTAAAACPTGTITPRTISDMSFSISGVAQVQDITFSDSLSTLLGTQDFCGSKKYTLSPSKSFLTLSGTTISLSTTEYIDVGTYIMVVRVELASYSSVLAFCATFQVTITCTVTSLSIANLP